MNKEELDSILKEHALWLQDSRKGKRADLSRANLTRADLRWANLSQANLSQANLSGADLYDANLTWADLSRAKLLKANLSWANLSKANLSKANLSFVNLYKANLLRANLTNTNFRQAHFDLTITDTPIMTFNGGRHQAVYFNNILTIGCQSHSLEHWLEHIQEIGIEHNYNQKEITQYLRFVILLKAGEED